MKLVKVIIRTTNGLIVEGELTSETIGKLKKVNQVSVRKNRG